MKAILVLTVVGLTVMAGALVQAQGLTQPWDQISPLTPEDRAIIRSTVEGQIHGKRLDTIANWNNPASGHSGTITLLNKTRKQGMPCERIAYQIWSRCSRSPLVSINPLRSSVSDSARRS